MAATFQWSESNTVSETVTDGISNLNFVSTDAPNASQTIYPITRPNSSFTKYLRAKFSGVWSEISNMKFWKSSGTYVTDEVIKAAANVAFVTPTQTSTGDSEIPITEGTALSVNSYEGPSTITYGSGVSGYTAYLRLQLQMSASTPAGAVNQKAFTFQYDEV